MKKFIKYLKESSLSEGKIKFNAENWSGKEVEVVFNEDTLKFTCPQLDGYKFWLKRVDDEKHDAIYDIYGNEWTDPIGTVSMMKGQWLAIDSSSDLEREDKNKFVAAIKMLLNVI